MDYFALFATIFCICTGIYDFCVMIYHIKYKQWELALMMLLLCVAMVLCTLINMRHL